MCVIERRSQLLRLHKCSPDFWRMKGYGPFVEYFWLDITQVLREERISVSLVDQKSRVGILWIEPSPQL